MPLRYSALEARRNFAMNPGSRWFKAGIDVNDRSGTFAVQRLKNDVFLPENPRAWASEYRMTPDSSLFAIGSCFARGIEHALLGAGFSVPSYADEFDAFELARADVTGRGFTNKYTTFAIENEIRWALDETASLPEASLIDISEVATVDPHVNPTLKWVSRSDTIARHETITNVYQRIASVDALVITLGLVEAWLDTETGVWLNMTPTPEMFELYPDRYVFEVTNFQANRSALERISDLVRTHASSDCQIVVTVSPVPLMATFSARDVVAANAYSKSVLRAAAEEWSVDNDNVHYFPSYEIVTNSATDLAWEADGRHVQGQIVGHIMKLFKSEFVQAVD